MSKISSWIRIIVLILVAITVGCSKLPEKGSNNVDGEQKFLTIATGGVSGPYYTIGGALAKVYKEKLGYNATVQSTDGSVENVNLLKKHKADLAFVMSDAASFALKGQENFKISGPTQKFKAVAGLYFNYVQIVTLKENQINSVYDLKGKRVGVGAPNSGVEVNARMILGEHGITYNELKPEYLSYNEAIEQLKNKTIDAAFVTSGLPNNAVLELQRLKEVMIVPIQPADVDQLIKRFPFFEKAEIPTAVYQNVSPVPTVAIRNILLVRSDLKDDQVYKITKTFFESLDVVQKAHQAANQINRKEAGKGLVVPLHPGAKKYYKENGDQ
ncbi:TAXI family TRAP transporter solute-binding subunit [Neobacillus cucumis]|uniref:TAXI family TRAP transporter solute-binding subunit n=1 Tax=Neobacillus cucumis TaxID=1740721 RepID=UPI002040F21E|nr:TAXI family TRAP transporter solute-binding subunit [Neobacillus cucumis]MCM3727419.1 TAXI family TRAP transporter solute-binding subunit [Neobacillus cucumis]